MSKVAVLAIGGNSLIPDAQHQTIPDQHRAAAETCRHVVRLIREGYNVVLTHGNGPQVGFLLRRSELAAHELHRIPLDICVADTQGAIGYQLQIALRNEFQRLGMNRTALTVVTQVIVDRDDPAFKKPSKPVGGFMSAQDAEKRRAEWGWEVVEDAGRGWRRVVASPEPKEIVEFEPIEALVKTGFVVVAVGGGGIPVYQDPERGLVGTAAVIDKDLASSLLASKLKADLLIVSTAVEKVYLHFGKPEQKALDSVTVGEARRYIAEGHFKPGSMLPKVQAAVGFVERGGEQAIITDPDHLVSAVKGSAGTRIVAG
ncbi:MAG: carbamate kinase [Armatimonadetes bacterium]|nr:carbamate kinase [Armatimonadota bacterium]